MSLCARASSSKRCWAVRRQIGDTRGAKRGRMARSGLAGWVIIDHRQSARPPARAGRAFEPVIDLNMQELAGLIEQIDPTTGRRAGGSFHRPAGPNRRQLRYS